MRDKMLPVVHVLPDGRNAHGCTSACGPTGIQSSPVATRLADGRPCNLQVYSAPDSTFFFQFGGGFAVR
jgi:hypothetical protein